MQPSTPTRIRLGAAIAFALAALVAAPPGVAAVSGATTVWLAQSGADIGESGAADAARRATGGRVLSVKRRGNARRPVYEVKVLIDGGIMRVLLVDGRTGAVR